MSVERKAAGWAVREADTRLSDSAGSGGGRAKGDGRNAYRASKTPCRHDARGNLARGAAKGKGGGKAQTDNQREV